MTAKVKVDLGNVQEQVGDTTKHACRLGRRFVLTSLGVVGMTYDKGKSVVHSAEDFAAKAEQRGEQIEEAFNAKVQNVQDQVTTEIHERRTQIETKIDGVSKEVSERGKSIEDTVQKAFTRLKVGDTNGATIEGEQIDIEVGAEIEPEIGSEAGKEAGVEVESETVTSVPIEGYDELSAQEIVAKLADLDPESIESIRAYEAANKNRVTIIREIEEHTNTSSTSENDG